MIVPILAAVVFGVVFILMYKHFRGYYPGSTVVESPTAKAASLPEEGAPVLKFFYTTWCPHSRKALPEWNSLRDLVNNQGIKFGGQTLQFETYDGDSSAAATARYGIDAYPSLVLETTDKIIHYDSPIRADRVRAWLVQTLGPESH